MYFLNKKKVKQSKYDFFRPLFDERCNYNLMIEYVTIWKLRVELPASLQEVYLSFNPIPNPNIAATRPR